MVTLIINTMIKIGVAVFIGMMAFSAVVVIWRKK